MRAGVHAGTCRLALLLVLAGCHDMGIGLTYTQRWVGPVTPADQANCGPPTRATLTRRGNAFTFTPTDGALVIEGAIAPDGHLHGTLALVGAEKRPFPVTLDGTLSQAGFRGVYATPRCTAEVALLPPA